MHSLVQVDLRHGCLPFAALTAPFEALQLQLNQLHKSPRAADHRWSEQAVQVQCTSAGLIHAVAFW